MLERCWASWEKVEGELFLLVSSNPMRTDRGTALPTTRDFSVNYTNNNVTFTTKLHVVLWTV